MLLGGLHALLCLRGPTAPLGREPRESLRHQPVRLLEISVLRCGTRAEPNATFDAELRQRMVDVATEPPPLSTGEPDG